MGTAVTVTNISGPDLIGPEMYAGVFSLALDTTDANGAQTVDLTSYFSYIHFASVGGNDTLGDNGYHVLFECPTYTTAITSTNVLINVFEAGADGAILDAVASTDLSAIGDMRIFVVGKRATS